MTANDTQLPWPPGHAAHIAYFIYQAAPRPVREVAIVATLGLLSGICGRQWQISNTGLNNYLILIARSGIGKEAMHSGISTLLSAVAQREPRIVQFITFDDMASGQALVKATLANPCFANLAGEFGHKFASMANPKQGDAMSSLRRAMTNLYSKSGARSIAGGLTYSNQEQNVQSSMAVAYSMVGDTTPGTFYEAITSGMMSDGFLSRFTIVQYEGDRPEKNPSPLLEPPAELINGLADLARQARELQGRNTFQPVSVTDDAQQLLTDFENECDGQVRGAAEDESRRQMWNRAHLKVVRIAALLAVADNCIFPSITTDHAQWAIGLIRRDIATFSARLQSGDIGEGDDSREAKMLTIANEYLNSGELPKSAKEWERLRAKGIIPRKYLQHRTQKVSAFCNHPLGAVKAMEGTIKSLIDSGHFQEVPKNRMFDEFTYHGKAYWIHSVGQFKMKNWGERFDEAAARLTGTPQS